VARRRWSARDLVRQIDWLAATPQARTRARALGERMRTEDGVTAAVHAIERVAATTAR